MAIDDLLEKIRASVKDEDVDLFGTAFRSADCSRFFPNFPWGIPGTGRGVKRGLVPPKISCPPKNRS